MKITIEFWDFIEKYLPDYNKRDDVLRHSNLQLFIDGHESDIENENLTVEEAKTELSSISLKLCDDVIDAYTKGLGVECEHCKEHKSNFCPDCGKKISNEQVKQSPWRCSECGSLEVQEKAWVDTNTHEVKDVISDGDDDDHWCDYCEQHTRQVQENDLIKEINEWWEQLDTETMEVITNLEDESFITEPDPNKAFDIACNKYWIELNTEQKIEIWKHYNYNQQVD